MSTPEIFQARTELAQQMGQKAEALRREAEVEAIRCEGHIGCLAQVIDILSSHLLELKSLVAGGELEASVGQDRSHGLMAASNVAGELKCTAEANLSQARGRVQQAERTLDMMEAIFTADVAAASLAVHRAKATQLGPIDESRHPGPSIADQRREEEAEDGTDPGPSSADSLP